MYCSQNHRLSGFPWAGSPVGPDLRESGRAKAATMLAVPPVICPRETGQSVFTGAPATVRGSSFAAEMRFVPKGLFPPRRRSATALRKEAVSSREHEESTPSRPIQPDVWLMRPTEVVRDN